MFSKVFLSVIFLALAMPLHAAEFYFGTTSPQASLAMPIEIGVFLNSEDEDINAIEGAITFPADADLLEIREGSSIISLWIKQPNFFCSSPTDPCSIQFSGIIPGGFSGRDGYLFSFVLTPNSLGSFAVTTIDERVLLDDGEGTEVAVRRSPLTLEIIEQATATTYLPPHDTDSPEPFTPVVARDPSVFDGQWFVSFATQDKISGLDHYEARETRRLLWRDWFARWIVVESPYRLTDQQRQSTIFIKAVDRAGNEAVATISPNTLPPWYDNDIIWTAGFVVGILLIFFTVFYRFSRRSF